MNKQQEPQFKTDWVVALQSFCSDTPTLGLFVKQGARYPVDHPVVQAHPGQFVDDHLTNAQMQQEMVKRFFREPTPHVPDTFLPAPPKPEETVVAIRSRVAYVKDATGHMVPKLDNYREGDKFHRDSFIPKEYPEDFIPLIQEATV
ncbi:MAG: hypothetical protein ABSE84_00900 [Isosphaeraceae bacterium]